jgi:two-component system nitrate/nitrite response regulator NarL
MPATSETPHALSVSAFPGQIERIAATKLAIINDDRLKAELLHFFCATRWGFEVVARESDAAEGLAAVVRTQPDILLLSLPLPGSDPREYIQELAAATPSTRIIVQLTRCDECLLHSLSGTPCQVLLFDPEESLGSLGRFIERARNGLRGTSARLAQVLDALRADTAAFPKILSLREQQVLTCIAGAMTDEEIGRQLGLSPGTALSHRKKIMRKLGFRSTPKLIRYCMHKGFHLVPKPEPKRT